MNETEKKVADEYAAKGYKRVHCGAPDFIFYKVKDIENPTIKDIDFDSVEFVEVKFNGDELKHEQKIWREILEKKGLNYKLIHIHSRDSKPEKL